MSGRSDVVAVVDATDAGVAVWWVHAGLPNGMSRLCGAWVVESGDASTLDALTFDRISWPTERGAKALADAGIQPGRLLDAAATVARAQASLARCQAAFAAAQAARRASNRMTVPRWPEFPDLLDPDAQKPLRKAEHASVAKALSAARWLDGLCSRWEEFETARLSRPMLRDLDGPDARPLPVVTS